MSEFTGHNGDLPSSIAGIADTGSMAASEHGKPSGKPANFVSTAKRESGLGKKAQDRAFADMQFLTLVQDMGASKLEKPFVRAQLDDLRHGDQPDGFHSRTLVLAVIAGAKTLPYASDAAMDLWAAQNDDHEPSPVAPHLDIDDAA